jgi:AhpD family alkylhydroperoxidase
MSTRIELTEVAREGFHSVMALQKYVDANVDRTVLHLVQMCASLLNGCTFCIDMHTREALAAGEDPRRLTGVAGWRESGLFDERERAALALTEAVTRLEPSGVPDAVWDRAVAQWSEEGAANLVLAIGTINLWNRMLVTTRKGVPA